MVFLCAKLLLFIDCNTVAIELFNMPRCICNCSINNGVCDKQHRCKHCKGFLHAICGHAYYDDDGNVVEDLAFPRICDKCHALVFLKDTPKTKSRRDANVATAKAVLTVEDGSTTEDDESSEGEEEFFDEHELKRFHPGFIIVKDLKRGESTLDRYSSIPEGFTSRSKIVHKMVAIPAIYWGGIEALQKDKWWKTPTHTQELRKLTLSEIEKTLLIGKVISSGKKNTWEVALICAKNEISIIYGKRRISHYV